MSLWHKSSVIGVYAIQAYTLPSSSSSFFRASSGILFPAFTLSIPLHLHEKRKAIRLAEARSKDEVLRGLY